MRRATETYKQHPGGESSLRSPCRHSETGWTPGISSITAYLAPTLCLLLLLTGTALAGPWETVEAGRLAPGVDQLVEHGPRDAFVKQKAYNYWIRVSREATITLAVSDVVSLRDGETFGAASIHVELRGGLDNRTTFTLATDRNPLATMTLAPGEYLIRCYGDFVRYRIRWTAEPVAQPGRSDRGVAPQQPADQAAHAEQQRQEEQQRQADAARAAEQRRLAQVAQERRAAEEAELERQRQAELARITEHRRLAEAAEAQRMAAEAERQRLAEAAEREQQQQAQLAREQEQRRAAAAEAAEQQRIADAAAAQEREREAARVEQRRLENERQREREAEQQRQRIAANQARAALLRAQAEAEAARRAPPDSTPTYDEYVRMRNRQDAADTARRRRMAGQMAGEILGALEQARQRSDPAPSPPPDSPGGWGDAPPNDDWTTRIPGQPANGIAFRFVNTTPNTLHLEVYSEDGAHVWPGGNQVWVLEPGSTHEYHLEGSVGQRLVYGAWVAGEEPLGNTFWGAGKGNQRKAGIPVYTIGQGNAAIRLTP